MNYIYILYYIFFLYTKIKNIKYLHIYYIYITYIYIYIFIPSRFEISLDDIRDVLNIEVNLISHRASKEYFTIILVIRATDII